VAAMEQEIYELLSQNLNNAISAEGSSDLYGFKVRKVEVIPFYNLSEPEVLTQQVAEFMKYRAPVQVVQEFVEKIKLMTGLMKESDMVGQKMGLDKLMNDIRGNLVNVYGILKFKLNGINKDPRRGNTLKTSIMSTAKSNSEQASKLIAAANQEGPGITEAQNSYIAIYPEYLSDKKIKDEAESRVSKISRSLSDKQSKLAALQKKNSKTTGSAIESQAQQLKDEIKGLEENLTAANSYLNTASQDLAQSEQKKDEAYNLLNQKLTLVINNLTEAKRLNKDSFEQVSRLLNHIDRYLTLHRDTIALIDSLGPELVQLESQSSQLIQSAQSDDSAVSGRIKADMEKQLTSIKKETFSAIRQQLDSNARKLEAWKGALQTFLNILNQSSAEIDLSLSEAAAVQNQPDNAQRCYKNYPNDQNVTTGFKKLNEALKDLNALDRMKETYVVPVYILEPLPNDKELEAFETWFFNKYGNADGENPPAVVEDKDLKAIREGVKGFAGEVGKQGSEEAATGQQQGDGSSQGSDSEAGDNDKGLDIMTRFSNFMELPSINGYVSSAEELARIGASIQEADSSQTINESPFDAPSQGMDTVNETEKNFFDYEIERIRKLISMMKDFIGNLGEDLIESLYMNEYIVSAFKNETTVSNILEHDIGWDRPLDQTAFKKAEVEYVIFGSQVEKTNVDRSKRTVFAIRLVFNLLHVYTDPEKLSTTMSLATAIAGWTIFGVPVVQNFLLISWAGLESYLDTEILFKGGQVPLIKTKASWYLQPASLKDYLMNNVLGKLKNLAVEKLNSKIEDASLAIEETVTSFIDARIDEVFEPFETAATSLSAIQTDIENDISSFVTDQLITSNLDFSGFEAFTGSLPDLAQTCIKQFGEKLRTIYKDRVTDFKEALKTKIREAIFRSPLYLEMVQKLKDLGNSVIQKGITAIEGKIDSAFSSTNKSASNNIAGRLVMMDYIDYLRLMLLAVPRDKKALRSADLMQMNMQTVSGKNDLRIANYHTYLFIRVDLDMNLWFLPEGLFKNKDAGMISVEWSQGY
ncbi:MAG: DUF5702 domain-containing protein, partial [Clostridia bacterium]|nr:DUF5702 domain-containing protein [Clostridia bacterium]